ncbi:hypothetical protein C1645_279968 [Glomus cerebriforme]|uniref:Uncharacterized protein n=1 Tax=Glomus cerebriforme TaxID=658196 RepID=A0A397TCD6_9GLOM|nr:hypothetical protein C1645_588856 [Glomus cerebriforme]RIA97381.1 hypothetical protein C1645_279968 [Glomus cerebriforme]
MYWCRYEICLSYLPGNILLILFTLYFVDVDNIDNYISICCTIQCTILIIGLRFFVPGANLGKIPFNCNFNHDLPENIKIACKARLITCTLGFSSYALPFIFPLYIELQPLLKKIQNNLFVL